MNWIVCGFYTPDYAHWFELLKSNLDEKQIPYDFQCTPKHAGGWEANTMAKPREIKAAVARNPDKTVLFIDVDCEVCGTAHDIAQLLDIKGDIGFFARTRFRRNGKPLFAPRSGTFIVRPTPQACQFLDAWAAAEHGAPKHAVDQDTLLIALGRMPDISFTILPNKACAVPADQCAEPIILHDRASAHVKKASRLEKFLGRWSARKIA